ncbi:MAG: hypothetical protein CMC08_07310, partial [Flavobacteriaceae bacterium]|nr:hypothetical protein [Flavobacteriaceae bacterium]
KPFMHLLVYDTLTKADYTFIKEKMQDYQTPIGMLVELKEYEGFTFQAFWEDIKIGFNSYNKFKKIAIVTDKHIKALIKTADFLTPGLDFKVFLQTERAEAIHWIENK